MFLAAYKINNVPVSELGSYDEASLNGKAPFLVANSVPAGYEDISSIINFDKYGSGLLGTAPGFRDWKCIQREIKALVLDVVNNDLDANWNNLSNLEKIITCKYMLSRVPVAKLASTFPNAADRLQLGIEFDVNNRKARGSWLSSTGRIQIMRIFLFSKIGSDNALIVFHDVVRDGLLELFEGGIEGTEEDGNIGLMDFILSRAGYSVDGLTTRAYPVIDGSGDTLEDVADELYQIAINGIY